MTIETHVEAPPETVGADRGGPRRPGLLRVQRVPRPKPSPRSMLVSYALSLLSLLLICIVLNLTVISQFQHWTAQRKLYGDLRLSLAQASTPVGQVDDNGKLTALGTPVALLDIPRVGIHEVVVEGSTSAQTKVAVGHRRDTPLPGQAGVSVLMGRQYAYGGVFGGIDQLRAGDGLTITTGQGVAHYRVIGPRLRTVRLPQLAAGQGRLTLMTASGFPFIPDGSLIVDAQLVSKAFASPPSVISYGGVSAAEKPMAGDDRGLVALSWLMELLVALAIAAVFAWKLWDRRAAWIVFFPLILATTLASADKICGLLPNML